MAKTPEEKFESMVPDQLRQPGVAVGRMYGSNPRGLTVNGKIFAFMSQGQLIVKLPGERVEQLSASGVGAPFVSGAKVMKEWMAVDAGAGRRWRSLMAEAQKFVGSTAGRRKGP